MMKTRNATFNEDGTVDVDIKHPRLGWIPFTASTDDVSEFGRLLHSKLTKDGNISPFVPRPVVEKTALEIDAEIDRETDSEITKGERADRTLLFRLMKAASNDPANYTRADFRKTRRAIIARMK